MLAGSIATLAAISPRIHRILIIEDEPSVLEWLGEVVRRAFDRASVGYAHTLEASKKHAERQATDLILLDVAMSDLRAMDAIAWVRRTFPDAAIVVVCGQDDVAEMASALKAGATGCIPTDLKAPVIVAALRLIAAGCTFVPPQLIRHVHVSWADELENNASALTERQRELLRFVLKGHDNAKIAGELGISIGTVKQHLNAIFRTIGVSSRTELLALSVRGGIRRDGSPIAGV